MNPLPRIEVDWNNAEAPGSLINLHLRCSIEDFEEHGLTVQEGLRIRLCGDLLEADAIVIKYLLPSGHETLIAKVIQGTLVELPYPERDSS